MPQVWPRRFQDAGVQLLWRMPKAAAARNSWSRRANSPLLFSAGDESSQQELEGFVWLLRE